MGGFGGSIGMTIGNLMIVGGDSADSLFELKDAVKGILESRHQKAGIMNAPQSMISDNQRHSMTNFINNLQYQASRLQESQKPLPTARAFTEATYAARSDTNRLVSWMRDHKKGLMTAAVAIGVGVIGFIFPAIAPFLSAAPITIGMVNTNPKSKFNYKSLGTLDSWQETLDLFLDLRMFHGIQRTQLLRLTKVASKVISKNLNEINENRRELGYDRLHHDILKYEVDLEILDKVLEE